jgi:large subunit ribosomal protein L1
MAKLTKKTKLIASKVQNGKLYSVEEAVALLSEFSSKKFKDA